jgi:hypothetical protein
VLHAAELALDAFEGATDELTHAPRISPTLATCTPTATSLGRSSTRCGTLYWLLLNTVHP